MGTKKAKKRDKKNLGDFLSLGARKRLNTSKKRDSTRGRSFSRRRARDQRATLDASPPAVGDPAWFTAEAREARRLKLARQLLDVHRKRYDLTKNPVFVWEAIDAAMIGRVPLPDWVTAYLGRVSTRIGALSRSKVPRKNDPPRAVYHALEFGGRRKAANPFTAMSESWHTVNIALAVWWAMGDGTKLDFAIEAVVRTHPVECTRDPKCSTISRTTVARAWRLHGPSISNSSGPPTRPNKVSFRH
jgi:hypothetical protein